MRTTKQRTAHERLFLEPYKLDGRLYDTYDDEPIDCEPLAELMSDGDYCFVTIEARTVYEIHNSQRVDGDTTATAVAEVEGHATILPPDAAADLLEHVLDR